MIGRIHFTVWCERPRWKQLWLKYAIDGTASSDDGAKTSPSLFRKIGQRGGGCGTKNAADVAQGRIGAVS